jgi:alpha-ketoglutarate-dependent taurine dioxygenase
MSSLEGGRPFTAGRRRTVSVSEEPIRMEVLLPERPLPLTVTAELASVDLAGWAKSHGEFLESNLRKHGALLLRAFDAVKQEDFERFLDGISLERTHYVEGATPRKVVGKQIYTSTEFPPEHAIALHNELSYVLTWPMKVCFFCLVPSAEGGETPIADVRKVYARIPEQVRRRFEERGWMLVRNFGEGLSLSWQDAFRVQSEKELEEYCRTARIVLERLPGDRLRTTQVRPAIAHHPHTGEPVWFNHVAFWHISSLEPTASEYLLSEYGERGVPYNTFYGDGSPIEPETIDLIRRAYEAETVAFPWRKGDLLFLDNMLAAHGRRPFRGERKIIVAMGEPYTRRDF